MKAKYPFNKFFRHECDQHGFTMVEIMIVLVILVAIVGIGVPRLIGRGREIRAAIQKIAVLSRELHHLARLKHSTYRLVIQLGAEQSSSYWVESASTPVLLPSQDDIDKLSTVDEEGKKADPQGFTRDDQLLKGQINLKNGLHFKDVEFGSRNTVITSGLAYIHYFPQGLVEEAIIHFEHEDGLKWSVAIHPLTGHADIVGQHISFKDLR